MKLLPLIYITAGRPYTLAILCTAYASMGVRTTAPLDQNITSTQHWNLSTYHNYSCCNWIWLLQTLKMMPIGITLHLSKCPIKMFYWYRHLTRNWPSLVNFIALATSAGWQRLVGIFCEGSATPDYTSIYAVIGHVHWAHLSERLVTWSRRNSKTEASE